MVDHISPVVDPISPVVDHALAPEGVVPEVVQRQGSRRGRREGVVCGGAVVGEGGGVPHERRCGVRCSAVRAAGGRGPAATVADFVTEFWGRNEQELLVIDWCFYSLK